MRTAYLVIAITLKIFTFGVANKDSYSGSYYDLSVHFLLINEIQIASIFLLASNIIISFPYFQVLKMRR